MSNINFNDISINLNNSNEDMLAFIGDATSEVSDKVMFALLKSIDDFGDIFEDNIVEDFYPSVPSNDMFTTAYNTVVDLISPLTNYVYDFFWGK